MVTTNTNLEIWQECINYDRWYKKNTARSQHSLSQTNSYISILYHSNNQRHSQAVHKFLFCKSTRIELTLHCNIYTHTHKQMADYNRNKCTIWYHLAIISRRVITICVQYRFSLYSELGLSICSSWTEHM